MICTNLRPLLIYSWLINAFLLTCCIRPFTPPGIPNAYNYLVIDGFINGGNDSTYIKLSRTSSLSDSTQIKPETNARVLIEGTNYTSVMLTETSAGNYYCGPFNPSSDARYRLHITTSGGSQYVSDYVSSIAAPAIDSVTWANTAGGITIYVNAHGNNNDSRYYRWMYAETWQFHAAFESFFTDSLTPRYDYLSIYNCWRTDTSTNILLGSTAKLSSNTVSGIPLQFIPDSSWKLGQEYSMMVEQQAIDENTYSFFQVLQQSTEQQNSIFAPQPSTVNGNFHCLTNPAEPVIGYLYATATTEQRLFIRNNQVTGWYNEGSPCMRYDDSLLPGAMQLYREGKIIALETDPTGAHFYYAVPVCADCRLSGTNIKPSFWPN
jgi:hypothetical protein